MNKIKKRATAHTTNRLRTWVDLSGAETLFVCKSSPAVGLTEREPYKILGVPGMFEGSLFILMPEWKCLACANIE